MMTSSSTTVVTRGQELAEHNDSTEQDKAGKDNNGVNHFSAISSTTMPGIIQIKKAIPNHCFEPRVSTSMYYVVKDFLLYFALYWLCEWAWPMVPTCLQLPATLVYWMLQGVFLTAIFVVGHDAGHGSFSKYQWLNDIAGNFCHGFLMCPYYMWKMSHRNHHKNTNNMDRDDVYYPVRQRDHDGGKMLPGFGLGVGWFAYLVKGYSPRGVRHFNPYDPMFREHTVDCFVTLSVLGVQAALIYKFYQSVGLWALTFHYLVPLYVFACHMVIITFLHHTEPEVPWYTSHTWDYVKGQVCSVDRHYGWFHNLIHSITTHQVHHLFPKIPHYHLEEATTAFRKSFPDLVNVRTDPILSAFMRNFRLYAKQNVVPNDTTVHVYK